MKEDPGGGGIAAVAPLATQNDSPPQAAQHSVKAVSSPPNPFRVAAADDLPNPFHAAATAAGSCRRSSAPAQAQALGKFPDGGAAAGGLFHQPLGSRPPWGSATPSQQLSAMTAIGSLGLSDAGRPADARLPPAQQHSAAPSTGDSLLAKLQVRCRRISLRESLGCDYARVSSCSQQRLLSDMLRPHPMCWGTW
jgi:hypothetical protein